MWGILGLGGGLVQDAFVVIVYGDGQRLLGGVLPDAMLVQLGLDFGGLLDGQLRRLALGGFLIQLLVVLYLSVCTLDAFEWLVLFQEKLRRLLNRSKRLPQLERCAWLLPRAVHWRKQL